VLTNEVLYKMFKMKFGSVLVSYMVFWCTLGIPKYVESELTCVINLPLLCIYAFKHFSNVFKIKY
jgi:hypothetical protein